MLHRTPKRNARSLADTLHRGFVLTCIGLTLCGSTYLGYRFVHYVTVYRPQLVEQRKLEEKNLLEEGSSENLKDLAPNVL